MKYRIGPKGWPVTGQHLVPPSELIDLSKDPNDYTTWEQLCVGKVPDPSATALDWDCAVQMWRSTHPERRWQLHRHLSSYDEDMYQQAISGRLHV